MSRERVGHCVQDPFHTACYYTCCCTFLAHSCNTKLLFAEVHDISSRLCVTGVPRTREMLSLILV